MTNTINTLLFKTVRQALTPYQHALLALSGGVDSVVLLHLLIQLRQQRSDFACRAIYIHHGLSQNASEWGEYCRVLCQQWQVDFEQVNVTVDAAQSGIEAGARQARYTVFERHLKANDVLLTAQHLDDQCETFFLALKRGSGPAGLAAMARDQPFAHSRHIRPLLTISRQQIEEYANVHQLRWVNDESNQDARFDRNFLRLNVLPVLQARWPDFSQTVARSAELCAEQESLLDELLHGELNQLMAADGALAFEPLIPASEAKRNALLRRWFRLNGCTMPSRQQLWQLWHNVALAKDDAMPQIQLANKTVRRFKQHLYLLADMADLSGYQINWNGEETLLLPDNLGVLFLANHPTQTQTQVRALCSVRAPKCNEHVTIRFAAQGTVKIVGREHRRTIKKLWQEYHIPVWQRNRIPFVFYNDTLIAALGVFITIEGQPTEHDTVWSIGWNQSAG